MTNLLQVPDKEKNYQSYMVFALTIIWSVVTGAIVSLGFYFFPHLWMRWLSFVMISIFIAAFNLTLNGLGHVKLASWSLTIMVWLYMSIPCYSAGGIIAPGILSQMSVILTAGFLLGWRGGLAIGILTIAFDFGLAYLEVTGHLPQPSVVHNPITRWIGAIIPFGTILALQYYATNHLRSSLTAMQKEITKREKAESIKDQTVYALGERIKELKTLYAVSRVLQMEEALPEKFCSEIAAILPAGWQYPDITAAAVSIGGTNYQTPDYQPSEYFQRADMQTTKGTKICIEVVYLQPMPELDEGPFLKEERSLINMLVEMLKIDWEGRERRAELKDYKYALDVAAIVSIAGVDGGFTFVNENFCTASKYSAQELIGKNHSMLWSGVHSSSYFNELEIALQKGKPYQGEFLNRAKDGTLYWVDSTVIPFLDEQGSVYQYLSINQDITSRKQAETELKESEEKFRSLVEQTLVGVFILQENKFKYINSGFEKMTGYSREKLLTELAFEDLIYKEDLERISKKYLLQHGQTSSEPDIFRAITSDGGLIYIEAIISELIYNNQPAMIGTLVDVTHRMEEEKRIGKAVIDAQENERLQIGMELHDNVKQLLAASNMTLGLAINKIDDKDESVNLITDVKGYIIDAIDELRRLSHQLAPSVDSSISLSDKISSLIENMNSYNRLNIETRIDDLGSYVKKDIPLTFYRILQEQLSNIIKYAEATHAEITVTANDHHAILFIKDNGKGFDINETKSGIGLQNIRRRTQMLGGEVHITSTPGSGCEILVEIPFG